MPFVMRRKRITSLNGSSKRSTARGSIVTRLCRNIDGKSKPHILEIYKLLPKTNCRRCGQPTCMMFASLATEGIKGYDDCPELAEESAVSLMMYLNRFRFD